MNRTILLISAVFILLIVCKHDITFNKAGFMVRGDVGSYPNRDNMLNDLIHNQKLKGLTYKQLIDKIGEPEKNAGDITIVYYDILTDYGYDIDPVYIKTLDFKLDKDSIVSDFRVNEIKH